MKEVKCASFENYKLDVIIILSVSYMSCKLLFMISGFILCCIFPCDVHAMFLFPAFWGQ